MPKVYTIDATAGTGVGEGVAAGGDGAMGVARLLKSTGFAPHPLTTTAEATRQGTTLIAAAPLLNGLG